MALEPTQIRLEKLLGRQVNYDPKDPRNAYTVNVECDGMRAIWKFIEKYEKEMPEVAEQRQAGPSFIFGAAGGPLGQSEVLFYKDYFDQAPEACWAFLEKHVKEIQAAMGTFDLKAAEFREELVDLAEKLHGSLRKPKPPAGPQGGRFS